MSDVITMTGLEPPRILPDHSILSGTFVTSYYDFGKNFENTNSIQNKTRPPNKAPKKVKKNLSKIGESFFMSNETFNQVLFTISRLETAVNTKNEIDQLWLEVKNIFLSEMATLPNIPTSNSSKQNKKFKKSKSFWNAELENLWSQACNAEKLFLRFKVRRNTDFVQKTDSG